MLKPSVVLHELRDSHFAYNLDPGLLNENFPLVLLPKGMVSYMVSFLKSFIYLKEVKFFSSFIKIKCRKALLNKVTCYYRNKPSFNDLLLKKEHNTDSSNGS